MSARNATSSSEGPSHSRGSKTKSRGGHSSSSEFVPRDGGWGWVVCVTSMWTNGTVFGVMNSFGIIYTGLLDKYGTSDPNISMKTAFVGSVSVGMVFLMSMVASILSDRIGIRPVAIFGALLGCVALLASSFIQELMLLYLTYGIMMGLGGAFCYSPSLVILGHYFKEKMGLVNGIVTFGSAVFTIALTFVLPVLLGTVGVENTFRVLCGMFFLLAVCALTWVPQLRRHSSLAHLTLSTESVYEHCADCCTWVRKYLNVRIWRNKGYVVWAVSLGVACLGYFVPFFHLVKYTRDVFPGAAGEQLIMYISITSGISRIVCGKISDFKKVNRIRLQQVAILIMGTITMTMPLANSWGMLIFMCLMLGICDGIFVCLLGPIAFDLVGPTGASQAIGSLLAIFSLPMTMGPPVAGLMYDHFGNYRIAFHVAGAPPIIGAILMFLIPTVKQEYPAVTQTEEFVAVSMQDILTSGPSTARGGDHANQDVIVMDQESELLKEFLSRNDPDNTNENSDVKDKLELDPSDVKVKLELDPSDVKDKLGLDPDDVDWNGEIEGKKDPKEGDVQV